MIDLHPIILQSKINFQRFYIIACFIFRISQFFQQYWPKNWQFPGYGFTHRMMRPKKLSAGLLKLDWSKWYRNFSMNQICIRKWFNFSMSHFLLCFYVGIMFLPLYLALVAASHSAAAMMEAPIPFLPGRYLFENLKTVLTTGLAATGGEPILTMLLNSFVMALCIATGKIVFALFSAFSLVYFNFPYKKSCFLLIFMTMMLPVEVRIVPTFQVVASLGWLNSYAGLTLPLMASATATFLFRQFFKTIPTEIVEAAKLDGAGPIRFFIDILLPMSKPQLAALFIIMFIYGWNQYLWPLVITTDASRATIVMGIRYLSGVADQIPQWHYIMSVALIALLPPCIVVVTLQRWFEKGLSE